MHSPRMMSARRIGLPSKAWGREALAPRANWKGFLKVAEVTCPVALYTAVLTSNRIAFQTINRATGHRVRREFADSETGRPVAKEDQVKGYEIGKGDYVSLEADEVASAVPESDKTLSVFAFIGCDAIDEIYFDRPYYLASSETHGEETVALICEGMRRNKVAALARAVLFRRVRTLLIRAQGAGFIATTLNFDYEVRSAKAFFENIPVLKIKGEMLELARYIIETKRGKFDPSQFEDRYENALAELVKAKLEGKTPKTPKRPQPPKVVDLMAALRESASRASSESRAKAKAPSRSRRAPAKAGSSRRKAS
jgi:DNA end-binding protein Ku